MHDQDGRSYQFIRRNQVVARAGIPDAQAQGNTPEISTASRTRRRIGRRFASGGECGRMPTSESPPAKSPAFWFSISILVTTDREASSGSAQRRVRSLRSEERRVGKEWRSR